MPVTVGQQVADFTADATGGAITLSALSGTAVVLFFYPKDNTPGCTNESADFRDRHPAFEAAGARVIGISRDSLRSHEGFAAKLALPYPLISDRDEALCAAFDVIRNKMMYGKQVRGIERSTFVIDRQGLLARAWRGVKVPGHAQEVLEFVQSL